MSQTLKGMPRCFRKKRTSVRINSWPLTRSAHTDDSTRRTTMLSLTNKATTGTKKTRKMSRSTSLTSRTNNCNVPVKATSNCSRAWKSQRSASVITKRTSSRRLTKPRKSYTRSRRTSGRSLTSIRIHSIVLKRSVLISLRHRGTTTGSMLRSRRTLCTDTVRSSWTSTTWRSRSHEMWPNVWIIVLMNTEARMMIDSILEMNSWSALRIRETISSGRKASAIDQRSRLVSASWRTSPRSKSRSASLTSSEC